MAAALPSLQDSLTELLDELNGPNPAERAERDRRLSSALPPLLGSPTRVAANDR